MNENVLKIGFAFMGIGVLALLTLYLFTYPKVTIGSTIDGQDYTATTTGQYTFMGASNVTSKQIKRGFGSLGSVVIPATTVGAFNLYDATTTDVTKRAAAMASSTILLASFPTGTPAGTYQIDSSFNNGLLFDTFTGTISTSTITYK